jgi:hypothetical protein
MNTMFLKKNVIDDSNYQEFSERALSAEDQESEAENNLLALKEQYKADSKAIEAQINDFKSERIRLNQCLRQRYEEREVPCKHFQDSMTSKIITIEVETLKVLNVEACKNFAFDYEDGFNVIQLDEKRLEELMENDITWLNKPIKIPIGFMVNDSIMFEEEYLYIFRDEFEMRLARWTPKDPDNNNLLAYRNEIQIPQV